MRACFMLVRVRTPFSPVRERERERDKEREREGGRERERKKNQEREREIERMRTSSTIVEELHGSALSA